MSPIGFLVTIFVLIGAVALGSAGYMHRESNELRAPPTEGS